MTITRELAQQIIDYRTDNKGTWREAMLAISSDLNYHTGRAFINKFINNKLGTQQVGGDRMKKPMKIDYSILYERW